MMRRLSLTLVASMARRGYCSRSVSMPPGLINHTPLLESRYLSQLCGTKVLLKMDALQPSGSFKDRGMAFMCAELQKRGVKSVISSSGGNAGLAAATMGRKLGMQVRVIVPETTKPLMLEKMEREGASVEVFGENWNAADEKARAYVQADPHAAYVPPYEDPLLWEGHSSLIDELAAEFVDPAVRPGAIVASVGGGGLMCGIIEGLKRHGWDDVELITTETEGAACFACAKAAGEPVRLDAITSVATSLGALECSPSALRLSAEHPTRALMVTDQEAVGACANFLDHHRVLVEPACGAALALAYSERHWPVLQRYDSVVFVVCGGGGVNEEILRGWKRDILGPAA